MKPAAIEEITDTWYQVRYLTQSGQDKPGYIVDFANEAQAHAFTVGKTVPLRVVKIEQKILLTEISKKTSMGD